MKKIFTLLCLVAALTMLAACAGNGTTATTAGTQSTKATEGTQNSATSATTSATKEAYTEEKKDANGNVTEKSYYENDKLVKKETFLEGGAPESVYEYNSAGNALSYTLYTYDESGALKTRYVETGKYTSDGKVLNEKQIVTYNAKDIVIMRGTSYFSKSGVLKSARAWYYDENGEFAYNDVTTVEENSSYYLFVTKRYDTAGTFVYSEQSQVHKTTGAVVSSFSEEMVYDKEGVLLAIKKTEPRTSDISVTVTYYDAAGKAGSAEIHLYGKTDGILLATYKITYHENGKLHEEICYKADGSFEFYRKYSENHKLLVTVTPNGSYGENNLTGYHYIGISDDGLTEMNVYFDPELNLSSGMIWEYYSPEGKTKTFTVYSDGKILKLEEYSEEGKLTKTEEYKEGVLEKVKKYEYISEEEGKVKTYDAAGNLISEEAFNPLDF